MDYMVFYETEISYTALEQLRTLTYQKQNEIIALLHNM